MESREKAAAKKERDIAREKERGREELAGGSCISRAVPAVVETVMKHAGMVKQKKEEGTR